MNGEDDYGEVSQADPERFIGPVDDENANAADRRERKLMLADHTKRNSLVYSHVLSLITDSNLKKMIQGVQDRLLAPMCGTLRAERVVPFCETQWNVSGHPLE